MSHFPRGVGRARVRRCRAGYVRSPRGHRVLMVNPLAEDIDPDPTRHRLVGADRTAISSCSEPRAASGR